MHHLLLVFDDLRLDDIVQVPFREAYAGRQLCLLHLSVRRLEGFADLDERIFLVSVVKRAVNGMKIMRLPEQTRRAIFLCRFVFRLAQAIPVQVPIGQNVVVALPGYGRRRRDGGLGWGTFIRVVKVVLCQGLVADDVVIYMRAALLNDLLKFAVLRRVLDGVLEGGLLPFHGVVQDVERLARGQLRLPGLVHDGRGERSFGTPTDGFSLRVPERL